MNGLDIITIGDLIDKRFGFTCPVCDKELLAGNIDVYYEVWCKCGFEMKIRLDKENEMINQFIDKWKKFSKNNKIDFKYEIGEFNPDITLSFRKNNFRYDFCISIFELENMVDESVIDTGIIEKLVELLEKSEV
ncbi:MAG: hypothetical protein ACRCX2_10200 [Paraclostridium sp.]